MLGAPVEVVLSALEKARAATQSAVHGVGLLKWRLSKTTPIGSGAPPNNEKATAHISA